MSSTLEIPSGRYARIAGSLYLVIAIFGAFAIGYVPSIIVVAGDAAATTANLMANRGLFGLGVVADVIVMLTEIVLTMMLYVLFRSVSPTLSLIGAVSRLVMVVVMAVNLLIKILPVLMLDGTVHLDAFAPEQVQAVAMFLIETHGYGIYV